MKIGIVTTWFERGAAYVSRQFRDVLAPEHDVYIYARGGESYAVGDENWDNERVTWGIRTSESVATAIDLDDLERWVQRCGLDVVFFNEQTWWLAILKCRQMGVVVGTYVDYYTEQTVPFFATFDFLICNTKRHYSVFRWHPACFFIPWGTDTNLFSLTAPGPVEPGVVTFFHSGGISPFRKGCDLVLQAFAHLPMPSRLVVHVQRPLRTVFPHLAALIASLEETKRLTVFEGTVPAPGLFHLGDVYVYPTRLDGIGLTILEANSCGLPVITAACEPMTEFIRHGINGRHVKVEQYVSRSDGYYWPQSFASLEDLHAQMMWYVMRPVSLAEEKARAREHATEHFNWRENAKSIGSIFAGAARRSEVALDGVSSEIIRFEQGRTELRGLSKYHLLRLAIRRDHPKLFSALARIRSMSPW